MKKTMALTAILAIIAAAGISLGGLAGCDNGASPGDNPGPGDNGGDPGGDGGFTEFAFALTSPNPSNTTLGALGGSGANQTQVLNVTEKPKTYFAVQKAAGATVTISGGADAGKVTKHGSAVDGITPDDTHTVFTVNTGGEFLILDGGQLNFTLRVAEAGKTSVDVAVTLHVNPDLSDGISLFTKTGGVVQRVANPTANRFPNNVHSVVNLLDAVQRLDSHSAAEDSNKEYIVRLEKNEALPKTALNFRDAGNVTVRLRGYGGQRTIRHDPADVNATTTYIPAHSPSGFITGQGVLNVNFVSSSNAGNNKLTLLEKNIVLHGGNGGDGVPGSSYEIRRLVCLGKNAYLTLKDNAEITGFKDNRTSLPDYWVITFLDGNYPTTAKSGLTMLDESVIHGNQLGYWGNSALIRRISGEIDHISLNRTKAAIQAANWETDSDGNQAALTDAHTVDNIPADKITYGALE
jgi:hypothetical protein